MLAGSELANGNGLALQVANPVNLIGSEQLEAAAMDSPQDDDRISSIDLGDKRRAKGHADVGLARCYGTERSKTLLDVFDIGKPVALQEIFGQILRRDTDGEGFYHPQSCRFKSILRRARRGGHAGAAVQQRHPCGRQAQAGHDTQELAAAKLASADRGFVHPHSSHSPSGALLARLSRYD
jgi:hypothetical protein